MEKADAWLLSELKKLRFEPYSHLLPQVSQSMSQLRQMESSFAEKLDGSLTKRQAVALGLLARTYQLGNSCLVNQLLQNYAGWNCSYRSLLETFFVIDWIEQNSQRFESYFEGTAPGIGRIKTESCGRNPGFAELYRDASEVTHVGSRALHLSRKHSVKSSNEFPFSATFMGVSGTELVDMLHKFTKLIALLERRLRVLLIENFDAMKQGEILWDNSGIKSKFGCLGWAPIEPYKNEQSK